MADRADTLKFNHGQLKTMIEYITEIRDEIVKQKETYDEYVNGTLALDWTTTGGTNAVERLRKFSEEEIQSFINDLNQRIEHLGKAYESTLRIDVA